MRYPTIYNVQLGYGGGVAVMRPISTSPMTINTFSTISRGIVASILRYIPTSYTITIFITATIKSTIARGRVAGILRPKSTSSITCRHSKIYITRNTIIIGMVGGLMTCISRLISKTSITTHVEITCLVVVLACTFVGAP